METSDFKWVVGAGAPLSAAMAAWRDIAPSMHVESLEIVEDGSYTFDLSPLDRMAAETRDVAVTGFVALGSQFMNYRRFELMAALKERGLKLPPLIARGAIVAADAAVGENSWIGAGAVIGTAAKIGYNCVIGARAMLGHGAVVGNSCWIDAGAMIGDHCRIGAHSIVGRAVMLDDHLEIGKCSVVDRPGRYTSSIAAKTFIRDDFDTPLVIVGS